MYLLQVFKTQDTSVLRRITQEGKKVVAPTHICQVSCLLPTSPSDVGASFARPFLTVSFSYAIGENDHDHDGGRCWGAIQITFVFLIYLLSYGIKWIDGMRLKLKKIVSLNCYTHLVSAWIQLLILILRHLQGCLYTSEQWT